jgi:probable rRNA maturation factor
MCQILLTNRQKEVPFTIDLHSVQTVVDSVLQSEEQGADFLSIEFLSDAKTKHLHKKFFHDSSSTDCMSFPIDLDLCTSPRHLGDIFICPMTALKYTKEDPTLFFDELTRYLVHGLLHLLGYDDLMQPQRKKMRQREERLMKRLRQHGQILSGKIQL